MKSLSTSILLVISHGTNISVLAKAPPMDDMVSSVLSMTLVYPCGTCNHAYEYIQLHHTQILQHYPESSCLHA